MSNENWDGLGVRSLPTSQKMEASFLDSLTIDYGPLQLLGRFFSSVDAYLMDRGITVALARIEEALNIHLRNTDSWHSFPPMLDPRIAEINEDRSYCFVCRNKAGDEIAVMAGRIYDTPGSLADSIADQSFIYGRLGRATDRTRFETWAPSAPNITAPFSYIGALWVRPDFRGSKFARFLPPLTRAYALAKWNIRYDVGLVSDEMARAGMPLVYGYSHVEDGFRAHGLADGADVTGSVLWMDVNELVEQLRAVLVERLSQTHDGIVDRAANDHA